MPQFFPYLLTFSPAKRARAWNVTSRPRVGRVLPVGRPTSAACRWQVNKFTATDIGQRVALFQRRFVGLAIALKTLSSFCISGCRLVSLSGSYRRLVGRGVWRDVRCDVQRRSMFTSRTLGVATAASASYTETNNIAGVSRAFSRPVRVCVCVCVCVSTLKQKPLDLSITKLGRRVNTVMSWSAILRSKGLTSRSQGQ